MFERRNIKRIYLNITGKTKDFLLSDKSREFFVFLFFFFIAGGFWLLQTLNNDYEAEFSIPVRLRGVPNNTMITSEPASELRIKVKIREPFYSITCWERVSIRLRSISPIIKVRIIMYAFMPLNLKRRY